MDTAITTTTLDNDNDNNKNCMPLISCEKLDRMANWVGVNFASAFFASLERCSCIHLNTIDVDDDLDSSSDSHNKDQLPLLPQPINPSSVFHVPSSA